MPNAKRQIWEKNGVPKVVKLTLSRNMSKQKQSKAKMLEREPKNIKEKGIEKNGLKWKWRETRKEDKSRIGPSQKWSLV